MSKKLSKHTKPVTNLFILEDKEKQFLLRCLWNCNILYWVSKTVKYILVDKTQYLLISHYFDYFIVLFMHSSLISAVVYFLKIDKGIL